MVYNLEGLNAFLSRIDYSNLCQNDGIVYLNTPCSFDIETTSFYDGLNKKAVMYQWQFATGNDVIFGRTWRGFFVFLKKLGRYLGLNENKRIIVYVHNLAFEFQFIYKWFEWSKVFATDKRRPIQAITKSGIEFRCSLILSGYALETLANNLTKHRIKKLKGDLDYSLLRHSGTPLTRKEKQYCANDVLIVNAYIYELMEKYGYICLIPLTQTGFVREYVRAKCFDYVDYKNFIKKLTLTEKEYLALEAAYMGGFTHCNAYYTNIILENVSSYDFTSSYPTVLISEKYPMGKGRKYNIKSKDDVFILSRKYCLLLTVEFCGVKSKFKYENILSLSRCSEVVKPLVNNGRIVKADKLKVCLTETDFKNICLFYDFESVSFFDCWLYEKNYLPLPIVSSVLDFYNGKTKLKGVAGKEAEYMKSKEMLNSIYGMCVTSIIHNDIGIENNEWFEKENSLSSELVKYNFSKSRFLFYPWGVWVTAYARNNLFSAILECGRDYVYSDTDSVKILNADKHKEYFERYNKDIVLKLEKSLNFYGLDLSLIRPKNIKGAEKILGVWDYEGNYDLFKSLGAKRYIVKKDGGYFITACGLSKKLGRDFVANQKSPMDFFNDNMQVDADHSGRLTHTYCDYEISGQLVDYLGNVGHYYEKSFVHLEKAGYKLSLSSQYLNYFMGLRYE